MLKKPIYGEVSLENLVTAADDSVKATLNGGRGLREFLESVDTLTAAERDLIASQAIKLLEGFYVHLPMKRAMHAVDPLQRLRLLQRRISQLTSEMAFHHEMTDIFTSLRDLHTNYILPAYLARMAAFLPFRVEAYFEGDRRRYIIAQTAPGFSHPTFVAGVTVTYWNGIPIERAVEIAASYHAGSNPAARHARGVAGLTKRAMNVSPPPDEEWVVVGYTDLAGNAQEFRADWTIVGLDDEPAPHAAAEPERAAAYGLDLEGDTFRRINKMLFAQHVMAAKRKIDTVRADARRVEFESRSALGLEAPQASLEAAEQKAIYESVQGTESAMPEVFTAGPMTAGGRTFAYVRIVTFNVPDDTAFVREFVRLIELPQMPKDGLVIDVRGNGGGLIWAGERLLQLLTPRAIEPCRVQFINTPSTLDLCRRVPSLASWLPSLARAFETGAAFSASFPITQPDKCNDIGQRYYGPVVLITDARCYSTTDIFTAGFQDHKIGPILGVDDNTGAGGANVWTLGLIRNYFQNAGAVPPIEALPKGADMRVAIRRTLRVGGEAGTELEDLGVKPDARHRTTRNDTLSGNVDLFAEAAKVLGEEAARRPAIEFGADVQRAAGTLKFTIAAKGVDYVDVFVDRRPRASRNVAAGGQLAFDLSENGDFVLPAGAAEIELRGYVKARLVCSRRLSG